MKPETKRSLRRRGAPLGRKTLGQVLRGSAMVAGVLLLVSPPAHASLMPVPGTIQTANSGYNLSGSNFALGPRDLPVGFEYFGVSKSTIYVNSNGNLAFTSGSIGYGNQGFTGGGTARIAPFWDYLFVGGGEIREVSTESYYAAIWNGVNVGNVYSPPRQATFEAVLMGENNPWGLAASTIVFSYGSIGGTYDSVGAGATVGLNQGVSNGAYATLSIGGADGRLTEAQAISLSNSTYCFTPGNGTYTAALCDPVLSASTDQLIQNPEPSTLVLLGLGAAVLARLRNRRTA